MRHQARLSVRFALALLLLAGLVPLGPLSSASAPQAVLAADPPDFPEYDALFHNYPEMVAKIQQAAVDHPSIVSVFSIGKSHQGRDIWAAKISDNVGIDEPEPEVLFDALHHAREHMTVEQVLAILAWLTNDYGTDPEVTRLVNAREVFIIFALNPDGFEFDLTGNPYRAWRKNRQPNVGSTYVGTDLNRNYDYRWNCCGGSSGNPAANTYRGPEPFSAPEARAMRDFVNSRRIEGRQQIKAHITFHTNGELILWPYGYTYADIPADMTKDDWTTLVALARAQATRNGYKAQQSSDMYITDGDQIDWMYGRHRIFSYTYELYPPETGSVWTDHYPPDEMIAAETARNRTAILHLIDRAGCVYAAVSAALAKRNCGPLFDDLEINRGWKRNPWGTDTATRGWWEIANPQGTAHYGPKQLNTTVSGRWAMVTGPKAGTGVADYDLDGGTTTMRSAPVSLPSDPAAFGRLTFRYYLAHRPNSSTADWLRVSVEGQDGNLTKVFEKLGAAIDMDAAWASASISLAPWAGQKIRLVIRARDGGAASLVEAAVDDIRIERP
jgi:carboxypeptidase T